MYAHVYTVNRQVVRPPSAQGNIELLELQFFTSRGIWFLQNFNSCVILSGRILKDEMTVVCCISIKDAILEMFTQIGVICYSMMLGRSACIRVYNS
jgi:hypothetical protein